MAGQAVTVSSLEPLTTLPALAVLLLLPALAVIPTGDAAAASRTAERCYGGLLLFPFSLAGIQFFQQRVWEGGSSLAGILYAAVLVLMFWLVRKDSAPRNCDRVRLIFYLESCYVGKIYYDNVVIEPESKVGAEIYDTRPANLALDDRGRIELRAALFGSETQNPADLAMLVTAGDRTQLLKNDNGLYAGEFGAFPETEVKVHASLLNLRNKTIIATKEFHLYSGKHEAVPGSSEIDDAHFVRVDGKKFLPVGFFGDNLTDDDMERLKAAGVNCYMPYTSMFMGENGAYVENFAEVEKTMKNARKIAAVTDSKGTYNDWGKASEIIDYIFYSGFKSCTLFETVTSPYADRKFISDHHPVKAVLVF